MPTKSTQCIPHDLSPCPIQLKGAHSLSGRLPSCFWVEADTHVTVRKQTRHSLRRPSPRPSLKVGSSSAFGSHSCCGPAADAGGNFYPRRETSSCINAKEIWICPPQLISLICPIRLPQLVAMNCHTAPNAPHLPHPPASDSSSAPPYRARRLPWRPIRASGIRHPPS